ncbi:MAG: DUF6916 family protein [Thermoanaerobaculia bacterium]
MTDAAEILTIDFFTPLVGTEFHTTAPGGSEQTLVLESATPNEKHEESRKALSRQEPFTLLFRGSETILPQQVYTMRHTTAGNVDIFIVPVGRDARGTQYEAIFN